MIGLIVGGLIAVAIGAGAGAWVGYSEGKHEQADASYDRVREYMDANGLEGATVEEIIGQMYKDGYIDKETHDAAIERAKDSSDKYGDNPDGWAKWFNENFDGNGSKKDKALYDEVYKNLPAYTGYNQATYDRIMNGLKNGNAAVLNSIPNAPAPTYFDTNPDHIITPLMDVEDVKLMSGQEMADLHGLNYDPDSYYDLIKAGTAAKLDAARYTAALMGEAANIHDARDRTSYLESIRNARSEALAAGATEGAQAAADLLALNQKNVTDVANNANVANQRFQAIDQFLREDAEAKLTARAQFNALAQTLSTDANTLYANDTSRFGNEWLFNADRYSADQNLLANRLVANMKMEGDYAAAQAGINAARNQVAADNNQLLFVFDRFYKANNGNMNQTMLDFENYVTGQYTGYRNNYDYIVDNEIK